MDNRRPPPPPTPSREMDPLMPGRARIVNMPHEDRPTWIKAAIIAFTLGMVAASYIAIFGHSRSAGDSSANDSDTTRAYATYEDLDIYQHSSKRHKKKKTSKSECEKGDYRKRTLQLAYELPFVALFKERKGQTKFEASSVIVVNDTVYAVCDSSWAISKFADTLTPFGSENVQIGDPNREVEDSGYEAILHDDGVFYVVRESIKLDESYHAIIEELDIKGEEYDLKDACPSEMEFEGDSKGFEGALAVRNLENNLTILGLCEGNWCSETNKKDKGNGRLIAMSKEVNEDGSCGWKTVREIAIPKSAYFTDYSAISMRDDGTVAISSQEDSQVWIGTMKGKAENGLWDVDAMELDDSNLMIYSFPKNDGCNTVYCNIEGLAWINDDMLLAVSDKMKKKQSFVCFERDQSVHAFVLPTK